MNISSSTSKLFYPLLRGYSFPSVLITIFAYRKLTMPRHKLELDTPEADFLLFGICSQAKDYRLVWIINNKLNLDLKRRDDIVSDESKSFPFFSFENKDEHLKFYLTAVKSGGNIFIRELKQFDYLLIIEGNYKSIDIDYLLSKLKQSESVLAAYNLNPEIIKSKQYLF